MRYAFAEANIIEIRTQKSQKQHLFPAAPYILSITKEKVGKILFPPLFDLHNP
jgi:hypothetical protein